MYSTVSFASSDSFTSSFPILFLLFIYFSCLISVPKTSNTILNKKVTRVGILVLFLILEEMLSAFYYYVWCSCGFVTYGLYYVELCSSIPTLLRVFIISNCSILSKAISVEMIIWFYSSVNIVYHIDCFVAFESFLHPWDKCHYATQSCCVILLMYCWIWFANNSLEEYCIFIHQWSWSGIFFFLWCLCLVLLSGWCKPRTMSLEVFFPLHFWE